MASYTDKFVAKGYNKTYLQTIMFERCVTIVA